MNLDSAKIFVYVASKGSFSAASEYLKIPVSTVSRRVSELEQELNIRLLERSTRHLRLTEAGSTLYEYISRGLEEMEAGLLALAEKETELKGRLRISIPPNFIPWMRLIEKFQLAHPNVELDLFVSEKKLDLIEDSIDVALRVGNVENLSVVARKITSYRHKIVASPKFLEKYPLPKQPSDLRSLPCAAWAKKSADVTWQVGDEKINLTPKIRANDYKFMQDLALNHQYFTEVPPFFCKKELKTGKLVELLPEHPLPEFSLQLVYPSRKQVSRIARVYIDYCLANYN